MKKIFFNLGLFLLSIIIMLFLFINFISDILYRFMDVGTILYISLILFSAYTLFVSLNFIIYKKANDILLDILAIMYFIVVLALSFNKGGFGGVNLNPFTLIQDFNLYFHHTLLLLISNIIIYFPIGVYLKYRVNIKSITLIIGFIIYIIFVEIAQYFLKCGILDINDIIANTLGFTTGIFSYQLISNRVKFNLFS